MNELDSKILELVPLLSAYLKDNGKTINDYIKEPFKYNSLSKLVISKQDAKTQEFLTRLKNIANVDFQLQATEDKKYSFSIILTDENGILLKDSDLYIDFVSTVIKAAKVSGVKIFWSGSPIVKDIVETYGNSENPGQDAYDAYKSYKESKNQLAKPTLNYYKVS